MPEIPFYRIRYAVSRVSKIIPKAGRGGGVGVETDNGRSTYREVKNGNQFPLWYLKSFPFSLAARAYNIFPAKSLEKLEQLKDSSRNCLGTSHGSDFRRVSPEGVG